MPEMKTINLTTLPPRPQRVSLPTFGFATNVSARLGIPDTATITDDLDADTITFSWPIAGGLVARVTVHVGREP